MSDRPMSRVLMYNVLAILLGAALFILIGVIANA